MRAFDTAFFKLASRIGVEKTTRQHVAWLLFDKSLDLFVDIWFWLVLKFLFVVHFAIQSFERRFEFELLAQLRLLLLLFQTTVTGNLLARVLVRINRRVACVAINVNTNCLCFANISKRSIMHCEIIHFDV